DSWEARRTTRATADAAAQKIGYGSAIQQDNASTAATGTLQIGPAADAASNGTAIEHIASCGQNDRRRTTAAAGISTMSTSTANNGAASVDLHIAAGKNADTAAPAATRSKRRGVIAAARAAGDNTTVCNRQVRAGADADATAPVPACGNIAWIPR